MPTRIFIHMKIVLVHRFFSTAKIVVWFRSFFYAVELKGGLFLKIMIRGIKAFDLGW